MPPATSNLFSLIAQVESTFAQFQAESPNDANPPLYQLPMNTVWPIENAPLNGSTPLGDWGTHLGLLMIQFDGGVYAKQMAIAWDWIQNSKDSLALFNGKIPTYALKVQNTAINSGKYPGLLPLTQLQLENMTLGEYATTAKAAANKQALFPTCVGGTGSDCTGGTWQWQTNTSTNKTAKAAVKYVNSIRAAQPSCS